MKKTLLTFLLLLTIVATPLWAATKTVSVGSIIYNIDDESIEAEVGSNANKSGTKKHEIHIPYTFSYTGSGSEMIETTPDAVRIVRVGSRTFNVMP